MVLGLLVSGCASIISTNQNSVTLRSNPEGANVFVWNDEGLVIFKGITPTTLMLKTGSAYFNGHDYITLFIKDGFENRNVQIDSGLNPWYLGNIVFGGLVGMIIVDPLTGSMWKLSPTDINIDFTKPILSPEKTESTGPTSPGTNTGWGAK